MTAGIKVGDFLHPETPALILPDRYIMPFRIDLTVNLDAVGLYLIVGRGIIPFKAGWQGRAIIDLVDGIPKPYTNMKMFDASFPLNEDTEISILYDYQFMMIQINGEPRYLSKKERYMKSPQFQEANEEGFVVKVAVEKHINATIRALSVTEYTGDEMIPLRNEAKEAEEITQKIPASADKGKETFEECIAMLPEAVQREIMQTNDHLLGMKKLKVRRSIEGTHKGCRISYNAPLFGFGYILTVSDDWASHFFWFSMHFNNKYGEFGARKCDYTEAMFRKLHEASPETAARIFDSYGDCGYCAYEGRGKCRTVYEYDGVKKATCHGKIEMNMKPQTFADMRMLFDALYEAVEV